MTKDFFFFLILECLFSGRLKAIKELQVGERLGCVCVCSSRLLTRKKLCGSVGGGGGRMTKDFNSCTIHMHKDVKIVHVHERMKKLG